MASSLRQHMERSHGIVLRYIIGIDVRGGGLETYKVSLPRILKYLDFPVEVCLTITNTLGILGEPFTHQHWKSKVVIM